ncbi:MAG: flagellar biosynthesis anti-sigma factor FlgM [Desulfonauticus sp.]|nr:flagellar biosynthesis anti-sigma factor FlgM [Desulfonauticus sp.]
MEIKNILSQLTNYKQEKIENKVQLKTQKNTSKQESGGDTISISAKGRLFASLINEAHNAPEVRTEKIESLKEQIKQGQYHPDPQKIAEKILAEDKELLD